MLPKAQSLSTNSLLVLAHALFASLTKWRPQWLERDVDFGVFDPVGFTTLSPPQSSVDPYGFERSEDFDYDLYEELMSEYLVVLTRRAIKWSKLLKGKGKVQKNVRCK